MYVYDIILYTQSPKTYYRYDGRIILHIVDYSTLDDYVSVLVKRDIDMYLETAYSPGDRS
jgi:hypothetical protein